LSPDLLVVILAAGASRRLGSAKQLVSIGGEALLRRQCRCALKARVGRVLVILGSDADQHRRVIADLPIEVRVNDEWHEGIAATLRHAVGVAIVRRAASLILPCDQYRITPNDLRALRDTWRLAPSAACVSRWQDYAGPPAILPIECYEEVLALRGDTGARAVLYHPQRPRPLEVANERATYDLDSPHDLTVAQYTAGERCSDSSRSERPDASRS
jgi:CTP:molybdopterin cytidylyltransferase MocA